MPPEEGIQQTIPPITFLLAGAGWPLIALRIVFSIWGLWNLFRSNNPTMNLVQSLLSLLPGVLALVGIYFAYNNYAELAVSSTAPEPTEIASTISSAMCIGFSGLISTIVPAGLGIIALWRTRSTST